jgi:hypothetical protein
MEVRPFPADTILDGSENGNPRPALELHKNKLLPYQRPIDSAAPVVFGSKAELEEQE